MHEFGSVRLYHALPPATACLSMLRYRGLFGRPLRLLLLFLAVNIGQGNPPPLTSRASGQGGGCDQSDECAHSIIKYARYYKYLHTCPQTCALPSSPPAASPFDGRGPAWWALLREGGWGTNRNPSLSWEICGHPSRTYHNALS